MKSYNIKEVVEKVENTSLEHAVLDYFQIEEVEDEELQQLMKQAKDVFQQMQKKLEPHMYE